MTAMKDTKAETALRIATCERHIKSAVHRPRLVWGRVGAHCFEAIGSRRAAAATWVVHHSGSSGGGTNDSS